MKEYGMEKRKDSDDTPVRFPGGLASLMNFWPALLVGAALVLSLPKTIPVLQKIPDRLVLTEADAAQKKPALPDPAPAQEETPVADSGRTYTDGVYEGSSRGYGGTITVRVTVEKTRIAKVDILSASGETSQYLSRAKGVIDTVLQAQTWEVDTVSGATYSSRGILGAIQNALTGEKVENAAPPEQKMPSDPPKQEPFDDTAVWKDGVYIGSARGFGGTIRVQVTIRDGKIADIDVLSHSGETDSYYNRAKAVISRILSAGTPNVDTVSGATYSSTGIINAVKDALKKAAAGTADPQTGGQEDQSADDNDRNQPPEDDTEDPDLSGGLKDGTYTTDVVCSDGRIFDYTIRLTMTVKNEKIQSITAIRTQDRSDEPDMNATYLGYAVSGRTVEGQVCKGVISQIIAGQSTKDVDIVSGATYSSNAILRGVKKLLAQAAKDPDTVEKPEDEEEENSGAGRTEEDQDRPDPSGGGDDPAGDDPDPSGGLRDGTYTAEAVCTDDPDDPLFDYTILATMKVEEGRITALTAEISDDRSEDPATNERYFDYAVNGRTKKNIAYEGVIAQILDRQSVKDIDTVSGATWSSAAIIRAVKDLLQQAAITEADDPEKSGTGTTEENAGTDNTGEDPGTGSTVEGSGTGSSGESSGTGSTEEDPGTASSGENPGTETTEDSSGTGRTDENPGMDNAGEDPGTGSTEENSGTESGESSGTGSTEENSGTADSGEDPGTGNTEENSGSGNTGGNSGTGTTEEGSGTADSGENPGTGSTEEEKPPRYLDGTYSASARCTDDPDDPFFYYTVKVTIKVEDGEITEVRVERKDDQSEDPEENELYMSYATDGRTRKGKEYSGIPDQILDRQEASGLDAVSGATYSSRALIEAAKKAVSEAENPE